MSTDEVDSTIGDTLVTRVTDGVDVPIRSLYESRALVLIFLRRFGCPICRTYALKLSNELHPILKKNNVGFVGIGLERFGIEDFQEGNYFSGDLYIDEGKKAYRILGLPYLGWLKGIIELVSRASRLWNEERKKLGVQGNIKGDGFQLGATYVVGPNDGKVWFYYPQKTYGDLPSIEEILKALQDNISDFCE